MIFNKDEALWSPYIGPQEGEGWINTETDEVLYTDEPPGPTINQEYDGNFSGHTGRVLENVDYVDIEGFREKFSPTDIDRIFETLAGLDQEFGIMDDISSITADETMEYLPDPTPKASYEALRKELFFNGALDEERVKDLHNDGVVAFKDLEGVVLHEVGHAMFYSETTYVEKIEMRAASFTDGEKELARGVSEYAATKPLEFVAEMVVMILSGEEITSAQQELYEKFNGPEL